MVLIDQESVTSKDLLFSINCLSKWYTGILLWQNYTYIIFLVAAALRWKSESILTSIEVILKN